MEAIQEGYFEVVLVRQVLNHLINCLHFFLTFLVFEVVILHLVEDNQNAIENNLVKFTQECLRPRQTAAHLLLLHDANVFCELILDCFKIL